MASPIQPNATATIGGCCYGSRSLGMVIAQVAALPLVALTGFFASDGLGDINIMGVLGGVILGLTVAVGSVTLRVGNINSDNPAVNALFFVSPFLALTWLLTLGVSLPRFDLFVIGAALIVAINVLLQLKPDQERDLSKFGKAHIPGMRLGFTAFIMSIWLFGTVVYLRDEVMPEEWLAWALATTGDLWRCLPRFLL